MNASQRPPDRLIRQFQSEVGEIREDRVPIRARLTLLFAVAMFVALGVLAASFRVDRVIASVTGQIVTADPTEVMQALDESIIKTIDVQEGDRVKAGQLLGTLDPTFAAADATALREQIDSLDAEIARCDAELAHRPFAFAPGHEPGGKVYAALQLAYFNQRKDQFNAQLAADQAQVDLNRATIAKLQTDFTRYSERLSLSKDEESMQLQLYNLQVTSRLLVLQAADAATEIRRNMEFDANALVETARTLQGSIATRDAYEQQWNAQTSQELVTAHTQRDAAVQQLEKAARHQDLVRLYAPDDAIVLRLARLSVGSIMQPGDEFIELAKATSEVEAEIYVDPRDVGFIRTGDDTTIKLDPFHFVEHGWAEGKVRWVSEGTFSLPPTGTGGTLDGTSTSPTSTPSATTPQSPLTGPYYKARIAITSLDLKDVPKPFRLVPGMTLTADIHVGTRSLLVYLTRGIVRMFDEAMREP
jgi:hemolysin D